MDAKLGLSRAVEFCYIETRACSYNLVSPPSGARLFDDLRRTGRILFNLVSPPGTPLTLTKGPNSEFSILIRHSPPSDARLYDDLWRLLAVRGEPHLGAHRAPGG